MKRIVIFLPSLEGGGAERVFVQIANQLAGRGISVSLVLATLRGPYIDEVRPEVCVVDLAAKGTLRSLLGLRTYLRWQRPDVVLSALEHANIVAILATSLSCTGTRNAVAVRSVPSVVYANSRASMRRWLMLQLTKVLYPLADVIIANSAAVSADLSGPLGVSERRLAVIHNPLDVEEILELAAQPVDHPWLALSDVPVVIAVGSLTPLKDFPTLLRAFAEVRRRRVARLVILGEGEGRAELEALAADLGIDEEVLLPGFVTNPFPWIRRAAVFVSSSLTEGCPNALMQALACDTAAVSTDCVGGSAEILEFGKWGTLVPVGDSLAMAEAIVANLEEGGIPGTSERARDFSIDRIVDEYVSAIFPTEARLDSVVS